MHCLICTEQNKFIRKVTETKCQQLLNQNLPLPSRNKVRVAITRAYPRKGKSSKHAENLGSDCGDEKSRETDACGGQQCVLSARPLPAFIGAIKTQPYASNDVIPLTIWA